MQAVNKFNDALVMFLTEVEALLEKMKDPAAKQVLPDVLFAHTKLDGLLMTPGADKKTPIKLFAKHMLPFREKIQQKDSSFFLNDLPKQPWLDCSPKLGSLFAKTCQQNQDQIWEYLMYLLFLAEGVSVLPEDQLEMVDELVEKLQKDPEGGMQQIMKMIQESADAMGDAGAASAPIGQWGGKGPVDDIFASMARGEAPTALGQDLYDAFLPLAGKPASGEQPLLLTSTGDPTAYLPDGRSDSAIIDEARA